MRKSDYPKVLRRGVAVMIFLLLLLGAFAPAAMAQTTWPDCDWYSNCTWGCTASDVVINSLWLGNCTDGTPLKPCTAGTPVQACIWAEFYCH